MRRTEFSVAAPASARRVIRPWSPSCVVAVMCHPSLLVIRPWSLSVLGRCHVSSVCRHLALCPPLLGICQIFPTLPPSAPWSGEQYCLETESAKCCCHCRIQVSIFAGGKEFVEFSLEASKNPIRLRAPLER